ncbi:hypothetical protein EG328_007976 [Venturia inaequalis]|uniref:Uncharacterized protein n=1 Tax=Venturia inaequalis TaxID=5025 RepID=A0A8H3ZA55_VENIN|nr:hypothetical protein EG328_007976 [Venturia inaequalis]KAE9985548.1 hypothetical protein EG327_004663 [Venturia inaequalis]RDI86361.1 hypothetical protein Vi05172_g3661 [Venturia inaequalis]
MKLSLVSVTLLFTALPTAQALWGQCDHLKNICNIAGEKGGYPCNKADKCAVTSAKCWWVRGSATADCYGFGF